MNHTHRLLRWFLCLLLFFKWTNGECAEDWIDLEDFDTCIRIESDKVTWHRARYSCEDYEGDLVKIENKAMNDAIGELIKDKKNEYWIGLRQNGQGQLRWLDELLTEDEYTNRRSKNLEYAESGFAIDYEFWDWVENFPQDERPYICQRPYRKPFQEFCPRNWYHMNVTGTCIRSTKVSSTWSEGRHICKAYGGDLVRIPNDDANMFVSEHIPHFHLWIGLHDANNDNNYQWLDDKSKEEIEYSNWHHRRDEEKCVVMNVEAYEGWETKGCDEEYTSVCEVASNMPSNCSQGLIDIPGLGKCFEFHNYQKNWSHAREVCQANGGDLVTLTTYLKDLIMKGEITYEGSGAHWLGLRKEPPGSQNYTWVDNEPFNYSRWQEEEKFEEDCGQIGTYDLYAWEDMAWSLASCDETAKFICEYNYHDASDICQDGWSYVPLSGTCMRKSHVKRSWLEARDVCQAYGGDLLIGIQERDVDFSVGELMDADTYWIGLHDGNNNNFFYWLDDNSTGYYWPGETEVGTCVSIIYDGYTEDVVYGENPCEDHLGYFCETSYTKTANCSAGGIEIPGLKTCLKFYQDQQNWSEARETCRSNGGDLVVISSSQKDKVMQDEIDLLGREAYWIGLWSQTQGAETYTWVDNSSLTYSHWNTSGGDCVQIGAVDTYGWTTDSCNQIARFICEYEPETTSSVKEPTATTEATETIWTTTTPKTTTTPTMTTSTTTTSTTPTTTSTTTTSTTPTTTSTTATSTTPTTTSTTTTSTTPTTTSTTTTSTTPTTTSTTTTSTTTTSTTTTSTTSTTPTTPTTPKAVTSPTITASTSTTLAIFTTSAKMDDTSKKTTSDLMKSTETIMPGESADNLQDDSKSRSLSGGVIAAIVLSAIAVFVGLTALGMRCYTGRWRTGNDFEFKEFYNETNDPIRGNKLPDAFDNL